MDFPHDALGRVAGVAVVDTAGTVVAGAYLSVVFNLDPSLTIGGLFLLGWLTHIALDVKA